MLLDFTAEAESSESFQISNENLKIFGIQDRHTFGFDAAIK